MATVAFSTTVSMWLGIAFLVLAVAAVLLQAWLWGPPFWDEAAGKTRAPRFWLRVHAAAGYLYAAIYLFMMWQMVPRLWRYQTELPARTVLHAVAAVTIGVLLATKILILRRFRHFEEAMPRLGFGLLLSTVILVFLSVPYAVVAHDVLGEATRPANLARVRRQLAALSSEQDAGTLATPETLAEGRRILARKCTVCHDLRTILLRPRPPSGWLSAVRRMLEKPQVAESPLTGADVWPVTAYLVAITPEIQRSRRGKDEVERAQRTRAAAMARAVAEGVVVRPPADYERAAARALLEEKCTACHELDEVEAHGGADRAGWASVIAAMVEEGAEVDPDQAATLAAYLADTYPPKAGEEPTGTAGSGPKVHSGSAASRDETASARRDEGRAPSGTGGREGGTGGHAGAHPKRRRPPSKKARGVAPGTKERSPAGAGGARGASPSEPVDAEASRRPDPARGRAVYLARCKTCHGADGRGQTSYGRKIGVPDLTASTLPAAALRKVIEDGRPGTKMRPFRTKIREDELVDLVAFLRTLR